MARDIKNRDGDTIGVDHREEWREWSHLWARQLGVPVDSSHPRWFYLASIDYQSNNPTFEELVKIRSYIEYVAQNFYGVPVQVLETALDQDPRVFDRRRHNPERPPYAIDGGHNTVTFIKRYEGSWGFRRQSWTMGPMFAPQVGEDIWDTGYKQKITVLPHDLDEVLEMITSYTGGEPNPTWVVWKAAHPGIWRRNHEIGGEDSRHFSTAAKALMNLRMIRDLRRSCSRKVKKPLTV